MALDIERVELGISAGLQDRVIQCLGGLGHMDFAPLLQPQPTESGGIVTGVYTRLSPTRLPPLYLAFNTAAGQ